MTSQHTQNVLVAQMRTIGRPDLARRIEQGDSAAVTDAMIERADRERRAARRRSAPQEEV